MKLTTPPCHVGSRASSYIYSSSAAVPSSSTMNTFSSAQKPISTRRCVVFLFCSKISNPLRMCGFSVSLCFKNHPYRAHVGSKICNRQNMSAVLLSSTADVFCSAQKSPTSPLCVVFLSRAGPKCISAKAHAGRFKCSKSQSKGTCPLYFFLLE